LTQELVGGTGFVLYESAINDFLLEIRHEGELGMASTGEIGSRRTSDLDYAHASIDRHQLAIAEPSRGIARPDYRRYSVLPGDL
jgi:hypothetical protein